MNKQMARVSCLSSTQQWAFLVTFSLFLQLIPGLADDSSSSSSTANKGSTHSTRNSTGEIVFGSFLGLLALVGFAVVLFKIWQKKRRQEQQARFLKLFEEDDDLEVELGIRD
ncbi:unnamed protein product [Cuscuta epithymum]|uniref:Transmembrane protein n=1 Tax=Cuscuta epithymum TaxID=186058 RepID=A0AAV0FWR2_9ASTE|nr:unnamed protein product [Cuscuta epithymum]